jgi:hypothetical protein
MDRRCRVFSTNQEVTARKILTATETSGWSRKTTFPAMESTLSQSISKSR